MKSQTKPSAKSIRNEERRRRETPIDLWLSCYAGFTAEQIETMKVESAARLAAAGVK